MSVGGSNPGSSHLLVATALLSNVALSALSLEYFLALRHISLRCLPYNIRQ